MRRLLPSLCIALACAGAAAQGNAIVTGAVTGTYFKIGEDLKRFVAPDLQVLESEGSRRNVIDLSERPGVSLAIVQSDVYGAFVRLSDDPDVPKATRAQYAELLRHLRVFMPLYNEEIHFIVRKDDPMQYIEDIKGKRLWMDTEQSGTRLTAENIYLKLFGSKPTAVEAFVNPSATGDDIGTRRRRSALMKLSDPAFYKDFPDVDVMVLVGGQPFALLQKSLPPNLKLLKFDPARIDADKGLLKDYVEADIVRANYPLLNMAADVHALAVPSYLVTANFKDNQRNVFIRKFATGFCEKLPQLQAEGHPKWKAIAWKPGVPLPPLKAHWNYSDFARPGLDRCGARVAPVARCSDNDLLLGICRR